ncbi:MAG TPA: ComEC/Rec2 family competence protein [Terriglobales bacterium]|nr:ComEC/Rec2 family competence protein [Terriglobales bacterium]
MSLRSREPLLWLALAFAAGILAGNWAWRPDPWWWVAFSASLGGSAYFLRRYGWLAAALAMMSVACLGALEAQLAVPGLPAGDLSRWCDGRQVMVTGRVVRDAIERAPKFGKPRQAIEVETESVADSQSSEAVPWGLRITLYGDDEDRPLLYGERVRFPVRLRQPANYENPGALDYRSYLRGQGIVATGSVSAEKLERLPGFSGSRWEDWRSRIRRSLVSRTLELWTPGDAALLNAMLIGQRTYIDRDTRLDFQRTGTYHILVVSGMNVGILALVVFWALRRLRASEALTTVIAVLSTGIYAVLTDGGPPILRATLMLWLYLGARLLFRERAPLNAVGTAALVLLVISPATLFDASFQLTFLSVLAIAGIGVPLLERTSEPYRKALRYLESVTYDLRLAPRLAELRLDLRLLEERLAELLGRRIARGLLLAAVRTAVALFELLAIAALMQVALALPMAVYFHRAAVLALPANTVVVPLATLLMPIAIVAVLLSYVWMAAAKAAAALTGAVLHGITGVVHLLGGWSVADVRLPTPNVAAAMAAGIAFALCLALARRKPAWAVLGLAMLVGSAAWITAYPAGEQLRSGVLEITSLDVGQGDSHLVITPQGRKLLLDAGGSVGGDPSSAFDLGEEVVSPYLWSRGFRRLDAVALSHAHADHMAGLGAVIANFRPRELWIGSAPDTAEMKNLLQIATNAGLRVMRRKAGDRFEFGGAVFEVLSPPADWDATRKARNDDSMVLRASYGNTAALLAGDAEKRMERRLAALAPRADLLKVAHHGSATSSQPELLAAVRPSHAVISAGRRNQFGYPKSAVLERLQEARVRTYRTDLTGAVTFYLDGRAVEVRLPNRR